MLLIIEVYIINHFLGIALKAIGRIDEAIKD